MNDSFNYNLKDVINSAPTGDMLIFTGGWNARPDPMATATLHALVMFDLGPKCANGDRLRLLRLSTGFTGIMLPHLQWRRKLIDSNWRVSRGPYLLP